MANPETKPDQKELTRRDFIRQLGVAGAAGLTAAAEPTSSASSKSNLYKSLDISQSVIVTAGAGAHRAERQAARMLRDYIRRDAGIELPILEAPATGRPSIIIARHNHVPAGLSIPLKAHAPAGAIEGYTIYLEAETDLPPRIWLVGGSGRAALFAVGRLLRWLENDQNGGAVALPSGRTGQLISTQPRFPLRGHQLGYRRTPNTYDAWNVDQFEQYIRDLVVFGANSVELIPTLDPVEPPSEIMPLSRWEMNRRLSTLLDSYDLDVWAWLPNEDWNSAHPENIETMLLKRDRLFQSMTRLDHLFIPGGDPGDMLPETLMPFLEKTASVLRRSHPNAGLWVSPQGFNREQLSVFIQYLQEKQPDWLTGVVYGPWVHDTLANIRKEVPARYPLRRYPDITHCVDCQYPVNKWDTAFAFTLGREPINPRPIAEAHIHNLFMDSAIGTLSYSEGVNDDVNKAIWSERLWDPERPVRDILVEYGRVFFGHHFAELAADGLLALEQNWNGPLLGNPHPRQTLARWRRIWNEAGLAGQSNWRLQQPYFRALYDVYVQERLKGETVQEQEALRVLSNARHNWPKNTVQRARTILEKRYSTPEIQMMRKEILELGKALWESIGMQMSVPLYHAVGEGRGAVLDFLDIPLNNRIWLLDSMEAALHQSSEAKQVIELEKLPRWTDPGPGGYYDNLGSAAQEPHLVRGEGWELDPGFVRSALDEFGGDAPGYRYSWDCQASTLYDTPLEMRYTGLESTARYRLRVVYNGRFHALMRLHANNSYEVHGPLRGTVPPSQMEFPIPPEITRGGLLNLKWEKLEGRGCQVAEVWLVRES